MRDLLLKRKQQFIGYIIGCLFSTVDQFLFTGIFVLIFDSIQKQDIRQFKWVILITILSIFATMGLSLGSRLLRIGFMRDTLLDIRQQAFDKIIRMSYKSFSKQSKDVYISHLINDINTFENNFFVNFLNVIFMGSTYIISFIALLIVDFRLAMVMFSVSVGLFMMSKLFSNKTNTLQEQISELNEKFTLETSNTLNGLEILKLNNIEEKFLEKTLRSINKVEHRRLYFNTFSELQRSIIMFSGYAVLMCVLVYMVASMPVGAGIAKLLFVFQMCNNMIFPLIEVLPRINIIQSSIKIYDKITQLEDDATVQTMAKQPFVFKDKIIVDQLGFSYEDQTILKKASFELERGKKYLIKGASGTGKSTLVKVLSMIYEDYKGEITVDGVDYKVVEEKSFNDQVAFIYQDVFLFEDTIRNNVTLFKDLPDEEVERALRLAGLESFVAEQQEGLETLLLENGKNLSGGQRQRLSIARAIAKNAQILFVDEGTSALNEEIGRQIEQTFLELDATVVAISHRYYKGVTEQYDHVLEIKSGMITHYEAKTYFEEVAIC